MREPQREGWVRDAQGRWVRVPRAPGPVAPARPTPTPRPTPPRPTFAKPRLLWKTLIRRSDARPTVEGEEIFVTGGESLLRLDTGGRTLGNVAVGPTQAEVGADKKLAYVGSDRGTLYAFRRSDDALAWKYVGAGGPVRNVPALLADRVVFESADNLVYGLDTTGNLKWKYDRLDGSLGYAAPVAAGKALYVCGDSTLYRLDPTTGKELWKVAVGGKALATPAVAAGLVVTGGDGSGLGAFGEANGRRLWRFLGTDRAPTPDWFGAPLAVGRTVYVCTYRRWVYAVDLVTGKPKWAARVPGNGLAAPALDFRRGVLFVATGTFKDNPTLTALEAGTGKKLWDARLGYLSAAPLVAGDRLYVASTNGYLYAYTLD